MKTYLFPFSTLLLLLASCYMPGVEKSPEAGLNASGHAWEKTLAQWIASNWVVPRTVLTETVHCIARIKLSEAREVQGVEIVKSCGNPALDKSLERTIQDSSPVPAPATSSEFRTTVVVPITGRYILGPRERPLADLQTAFLAAAPHIQKVFKAHAVQAKGKMVFAITVAASGDVSDCRLVSSEFNDKTLNSDMLDLVHGLRMEPKEVDSFSYEDYPVFYSP